MPHPVFAQGSTALITGAASGIGLAVAQLCRKHGMKLALVDSNVRLLAEAAKTIGDAETTRTYEIDVSSLPLWEHLAKRVSQDFGEVDLLMLNAGIGGKGTWGDTAYFNKIFDVNLFGVVNGLNVMVPKMLDGERKRAIVITGSKQGITNPPGNAAYNGSKAAIKVLAEHLSYDLRHSAVSTHLLIPGWTFTGLSGGEPGSTKEKPEGTWWPSQVADFLEKKMGEGKFYVLCPDNMVTEDKDRQRILYGAGDLIYGRQALSRWREETKDEAEKTINETKF